MKAKELAEILLKNPDFEVTTGFSIDGDWYFFNVIGVSDIGNSDKIIRLEIEEE